MKLYNITLFNCTTSQPSILSEASDVSSFGYFQRGSVQEFMTFVTQTLAERTEEGQRQSVKEKQYLCHVHARQDKITGVVIADEEYPQRVAFSLISKAVDEFKAQFPATAWTASPKDTPHDLNPILTKYQNPSQADGMLRVQQELDETKVVLHQALESVLKRDEKLDELVAKSDHLSSTSKTFYKTAKKANSCCVVT
eukprot:m.14602 g.14602  ORF g.14602 m.14602 type:complete len:197 (+) comp10317_c0_seq1:88-678(+)